MIKILEATQVTDELVAALERLVPQLSSSNAAPGPEHIAEIVESPATILLIARDQDAGGEIVGMLTLAMFRIPTGLRAWIEDAVVDKHRRGQGIGKALALAAVERAKQAGARTIDLTSRPSRVAANQMYQSVGFVKRETNVYRYGRKE